MGAIGMVLGTYDLLILAILFPLAWLAAWAVLTGVRKWRGVKPRWLWSMLAAVAVCAVFVAGRNALMGAAMDRQPMTQPHTVWVSEDGGVVLTVSDTLLGNDTGWYGHTLTFTLNGEAKEGEFRLQTKHDHRGELQLSAWDAGDQAIDTTVWCKGGLSRGGDTFTLKAGSFSEGSEATNAFFAGREEIVLYRQ